MLVDALLSPAAPGAVATAAPVSLEELSRRTKIPEPALEKLARRAPIFAGAVARFCRRLNWTCVADGLDERAGALRRALRAFDKKPASWRAELRGLRKACGGDAPSTREVKVEGSELSQTSATTTSTASDWELNPAAKAAQEAEESGAPVSLSLAPLDAASMIAK